MSDPFDGINEKLKRAYENIRNLEAEISRFFKESEYPAIPNTDGESFRKAVAYHQQRSIPPRFSILAGEIVHHLRSCLDHVVWQFSAESYRLEHPTRIEFPIFEKKPVEKTERSRYLGKVKGITNPDVLWNIEDLQPYNSPDPLNEELLILHKMDIVDKHRELVICHPISGLSIPAHFLDTYIRYQRGEAAEAEMADLKKDMEIIPQISFAEFGNREGQFVTPGLLELADHVATLVRLFREDFGK